MPLGWGQHWSLLPPSPLITRLSPPLRSYFAIFGNLFGFKNFGKLVAADNIFNSLFGLLQASAFSGVVPGGWRCDGVMQDGVPDLCVPPSLVPQYPLTYLGLHHGFTAINIGQAVVLLPLFFFAFFMYKWENSDLVPIRCGERAGQSEGDAKPCTAATSPSPCAAPRSNSPSLTPCAQAYGGRRAGTAVLLARPLPAQWAPVLGSPAGSAPQILACALHECKPGTRFPQGAGRLTNRRPWHSCAVVA